MEHTFTTPDPIRLLVELGPGSLQVRATDTTTTTVGVTGPGAEETTVTEEGDEITVVAPRQHTGFLGPHEVPEVHIDVEVPAASQLHTRSGSADQRIAGSLRLARASAGSGDITVERTTEVAVIETGSGSVELGTAGGDTRIKTGSGDVTVEVAADPLGVTTASGGVTISHTESDVSLKTASGSIRLDTVQADLSLRTGSGDVEVGLLERGVVHAKTGSGDLRLGVAPAVPVWTDISTGSGRISSDIHGAGEPAPGEPHLEIRARTGSGDIVLQQR